MNNKQIEQTLNDIDERIIRIEKKLCEARLMYPYLHNLYGYGFEINLPELKSDFDKLLEYLEIELIDKPKQRVIEKIKKEKENGK